MNHARTFAAFLVELIEAADVVLFGRRLSADEVRQEAPRAWMPEGKQTQTRRREGWKPIKPGSTTLYRPAKEETEKVVSWEVANNTGDLKPTGDATLTDADVQACDDRGIDVDAAAMYKPLFAAGMSAQAAYNERPDGLGLRRLQDIWAAFNEAQGTSKAPPPKRRAAKRTPKRAVTHKKT